MAKRELTDLLERDPEQEERAGIRLQGLLAVIDEEGYKEQPHFEILGEITSIRHDRFQNDVRIQIIALNANNQVVGVLHTTVSQGDPGYEAFEESTNLQALPTRIKLVTSAR